MTDWIFNENARNHRGVWHVTDDLTVKVVEERTFDHETKTYPKHKNSCASQNYRWNGSGYSYYPCDCGAEEGFTALSYIVRTIYPEHEVASGNAICGQVSVYSTGGVGYASYRNRKPKVDGEVLAETVRVRKPAIWQGDGVPPGPVCSRCVSKVEARQNAP